MSLSELPPEVLRDILNSPQSSWAALELWKAGDRTLNSKLANSGVTEIELGDNRTYSTSRWPKCLKEFRLERLSITRTSGHFYDLKSLRSELSQLYSGLKVLQLYIPGIAEVVLGPAELNEGEDDGESEDNDESDGDGDDGDSEEHSDHSHLKRFKSSDVSESEMPHQTMWDLGVTWPTLERLELGSIEEHFGRVPKYGDRVLSLLPRSLTYLCLPDRGIKVTSDLMPPGLRTLRVSPDTLGPKDLRHLPKTITDMQSSVSLQGLILLNKKTELFPGLAFPHSDFDTNELGDEINDLAEDMYADVPWPKTALKMTVDADGGDDVFDDLPKGLTSFATRIHDTTPSLRAAQIQALPRGLTSLKVPAIDWQNIDVSTWPSTLTRIKIQEGSFNLGSCCLLPRSLKVFEVECQNPDLQHSSATDSDFEALCALGRESLSSDDQWPSIKLDILRYNSTVPQKALETYIESIESGRLFGLPLTLTSLTWPDQPLANNVKLLLPPKVASMTHLSLYQQGDPSVLSFVLDAFPPTTSAHFYTSSLQGELPSSTASTLCSSTSVTSLGILIVSTFDDKTFKSLPWRLVKLAIEGIGTIAIHSTSLQGLPPTLKSLTLTIATQTDRHARWLHYLPRALETLCTPAMVIAGCHISELPQKLTSLSCSFFEVSLPQVLDLPRTLSFVYVERCGGHESTLLRHCLTLEAWNTLIRTYRPFWRIWEAGLHGMTIELSIASKMWPTTSETHHSGASKFLYSRANLGDPNPSCTENVVNDDLKHNYIGENVDRYLVDSGNDVETLDPRTSRRISQYL